MIRNTSARVCIIGAGPSGITAAKNLLQVGITNFVVYEKGSQVGGNWVYDPRNKHSSVYETTHIISSKRLSQYEDYPMPADYPDYPSHKQLLAYFQGYADYFGVTPYIRFKTEVRKAELQADQTWKITLGGGKVEKFDYLMVANGHHWDPRKPEYPGKFTGEFLHSHEYKTAAPFKGKRVLVLGGGNSACDIAVETSRISAVTSISMRRGYYIAPKFLLGEPADVINQRFLWMPGWLRLLLLRVSLYFAVGDYKSYGLESPDHQLLHSHQTMNSELLYFIKHGKVHPRRDVDHFDGKKVHFKDGKVEQYDTVIAATGFKISFPFLDTSLIDWSDGQDVPLFLRTFHPDHPSLFFIGLVQPLGCIWPLADLHAKLAANFITGGYNLPTNIRRRAMQEVEHINRQYIKAKRHTIEVDFHEHLNALRREVPASAPAWGQGPSRNLPLTA
jgi:thioredoxin reductase